MAANFILVDGLLIHVSLLFHMIYTGEEEIFNFKFFFFFFYVQLCSDNTIVIAVS